MVENDDCNDNDDGDDDDGDSQFLMSTSYMLGTVLKASLT